MSGKIQNSTFQSKSHFQMRWRNSDQNMITKYFSIEFGKSSSTICIGRYLSKKHFIGIVECFSKFFILHRQRSLLYKLFWCFCPRKIALLRNWCQIRFLHSLSTKVWILYVMYLLMMMRDDERIIFGDIFLRKSFFQINSMESYMLVNFSISIEKTSHSILPPKVELWLF